ncbi:hypothetical protein K469DRAFT_717811, partial [Zopfia rhizophila CBS 207.26]
MHWVAKVDANDVEFVLASPQGKSSATIYRSLTLGEHIIWVLDSTAVERCQWTSVGLTRRCTHSSETILTTLNASDARGSFTVANIPVAISGD